MRTERIRMIPQDNPVSKAERAQAFQDERQALRGSLVAAWGEKLGNAEADEHDAWEDKSREIARKRSEQSLEPGAPLDDYNSGIRMSRSPMTESSPMYENPIIPTPEPTK